MERVCSRLAKMRAQGYAGIRSLGVRGVEIRNLEVFVWVAQMGGFNRAAAQLHVAQSALSRRIAVLEQEIGISLLVRSRKGVALTPAGTVLYEQAEDLLQRFQDIKAEMLSRSSEPRGMVRIGFAPSLVEEGAKLLHLCHVRFPYIATRSSVAASTELNGMLLEGKLDVALFAATEADPQVMMRPLYSDNMFLCGPPGSVSGKNATWRNIQDLPLILPCGPNSVRRLVESAAAKRNLRLRVAMEVNDASLILKLVACGTGFTILPRSSLTLVDRQLCSFSQVSGIKIDWVAGYLRDRPPSAATASVLDLLGETARNGPARTP